MKSRLYDKVAPYLRTENPTSAQDAEGKTDTICGALKLALRKQDITQEQHDNLLRRVKMALQAYQLDPDTGSFSQLAEVKGWWGSHSHKSRQIQGFRHMQLHFVCLRVERIYAVREN